MKRLTSIVRVDVGEQAVNVAEEGKEVQIVGHREFLGGHLGPGLLSVEAGDVFGSTRDILYETGATGEVRGEGMWSQMGLHVYQTRSIKIRKKRSNLNLGL